MGMIDSINDTCKMNSLTPNDSEASKMLEAALQQMDGIISGATNRNTSPDGQTTSISQSNVLAAAQTLAMILQQSGNMAPSPDHITASIINTWLETHLPRQDTDERLRRLQTEKESMALQVQVLTEQVSAQSDKIADLERIILDKTQQLSHSEDLLQREMLSRSSLETQKLELMSAMSELKLQQAALERENLEMRASNLNNNAIPPRRPPVPGRQITSGTTSLNSTPLHGSYNSLQNSTPIPMTPKTPPASYRRQVDLHYSSLPRQAYPSSVTVPANAISGSTSAVTGNQVVDSNANPKQRNVAFAESEKIIEDNIDHQQRSFTPQPSPSPSMSQKNKGIRSIFGKIKRSNSGNLEDLPGDGEFRRGGVRATAGARLGWNNSLPKPDKPFAEWDIDAVCAWLDEMGLGCYEDEARKWLKKGAKDLVTASPVDIEKELNLKTPLHRKKISLALMDINGTDDEMFANAGKLDPIWIMRWLDDVGLPQHKDVFSTARVDGRMLHRLTMDDLMNLHVTSSLHAASIRRGIQVMRENNWNPECLIRRSGSDEEQTQKQVQLWTAHRVMEWLRLVDLAEYAPNLRGAGVHGALMMYEHRFTSELLADLLSIPPSKTLLRRHLGTHFKELLGRDVIQLKREAESTLGFQPLTLTAKIKTPKKSQFSLKRKKSTKGGDEWSDFVCPMGGSVPINFIEAVQGMTARIPCDITPPIDDDKVTLVIWYKDGLTTPIYSFDARDFEEKGGSHWADEKILNGRGFFQLKATPATFAIKAVIISDTGIYRCRVDFQKNPTRNSKFNLTVIIPPENIIILGDKGSNIPHYILGPYNEGANVELTCVSTGGTPQPNLTWWRGENDLLDDSYTAINEKKVQNVLLLEKLQRHHLHTVLSCQASNNNVTTPIRSAVTLNMNLRPLWVKLQGENKPLSAGTEHELLCEVVGSRPEPTVTWWKGSTLMRNSTDTATPDGNTTISMLKFTPTIDDSGKYLSCRGEQPLIPDSGLESGWKLDIHHVPVVSLELGSNLNSTTIREGADVYFECNIKSNPWVYKVNWRHNGKPLYNNFLAGIIVANQSLVLQNVTKARSGSYTCIGINNEGDGESNTVLLDIKYAPLCRPGQIQVYNIARHETAKIVCELESNPSHYVNFTWKFNTSIAETTDLPASLIAIERAKSVAHYTPTNEQDYGTLLCWGTNDIGTQSDPCIFNINPAGKPDALTNCTVSNQTLNVLQLECIEGFDGGLPQSFEVEVFYARTKNLVLNQSSKQPFFELKGIRPDYGYDIVLTAKNAKGRSSETILHMYTLNGAEKHTDEFPSLDFLLPYTGNSLQTKLLLGAVAGLVFGILLILIASVVIVRLKRAKHTAGDGVPDNAQTDTSGVTAQSCEAALRGGLSGSVDSLEKNPDIIPQGQEDCVFDDDSKLHWNHPRTYATVALAGQYNAKQSIHPNYQTCQYTIPENFESENYRTQQTKHSDQMQYATYTHADNQNHNKELTYAELSLVIPKQKAIYTSATLGRPRNKDVRVNEPTIYAQIDLAHDGTPHNGYSAVTWIPAQHLKSMPNHQHQHEQRMAPIVCSKESMSPHQILSQQQQPNHSQKQLADTGSMSTVPRF